jgi:Leucine-rich repeat (LRR) protein
MQNEALYSLFIFPNVAGISDMSCTRPMIPHNMFMNESVLLCSLKALKKISLQSNRLTAMTGLQHCTQLEELYLSHNGISALEVGGAPPPPFVVHS